MTFIAGTRVVLANRCMSFAVTTLTAAGVSSNWRCDSYPVIITSDMDGMESEARMRSCEKQCTEHITSRKHRFFLITGIIGVIQKKSRSAFSPGLLLWHKDMPFISLYT